MFCTNCGAQNPEGTRFCTSCGAPLTDGQPGQPVQQPPPPLYAQPAYDPPMQEHPVVGEVKRFASSPLFLAAVILFSLSVLFSFVSQFTVQEKLGSLVEEWLYKLEDVLGELDIDGLGDVGEFLSSVDLKATLKSSPTVSFPILPALTAVGLWLIFVAGRKRNVPGMNPSGLKMIKVLTTVEFVFSVIGLGLGTLAVGATAVIFGAVKNDLPLNEEYGLVVLIILITVAVTLLIALVFIILYYSKLIKSIGTAYTTATTGVPSDRISVFAAVMVILSGVSSLSSVLSVAALLPDAMLILSGLASGVASILFGVIMYQYRGRMRQLMMGAPVQ